MTIARSTVALLGTDEATGLSALTTVGVTGSVTDLLADDTSMGFANVYLTFGASGTSGSLDLEIFNHRVSGQEYLEAAPMKFSYAPIAGMQKIFVGTIQVARRVSARVLNNAIGTPV